jgi:tetratricopeptide (TPR) repeat protein
VAESPSRIEFRQLLAKSYSARAVLLDAAGRTEQAVQDYDQALRIRMQLAADFPSRPEYREELASSYANRGAVLHMAARYDEAKQGVQPGLKHREATGG